MRSWPLSLLENAGNSQMNNKEEDYLSQINKSQAEITTTMLLPAASVYETLLCLRLCLLIKTFEKFSSQNKIFFTLTEKMGNSQKSKEESDLDEDSSPLIGAVIKEGYLLKRARRSGRNWRRRWVQLVQVDMHSGALVYFDSKPKSVTVRPNGRVDIDKNTTCVATRQFEKNKKPHCYDIEARHGLHVLRLRVDENGSTLLGKIYRGSCG